MSSSAPGGSRQGQDKKSFSKFMRRASKVLKGGSARGSSSSGPEPDPTSRDTASPRIASPTVPAASALSRPNPVDQPSDKVSTLPVTIAAKSYKLQEEKARAVFAKYGLYLEPGEWTRPSRTDRERIEKNVRIRVHRQCHRCQTTFGPEKICMECDHTRCKKCPRSPAKRTKDSQTNSMGVMPLASIPKAPKKAYANPLVIPSKKEGNELIRKAPKHRVRRICHNCNTTFVGKATQCTICHHTRCAVCPRDPPKLKKWPNGYPGDMEKQITQVEQQSKTPNLPVRWQCDSCSTMFMENEKICQTCQHERCDKCIRQPPVREKSEPDESAVKNLEEKMAKVGLDQ